MPLDLNRVVMDNLRDKWGLGPIYLHRHLSTLTPEEQAFLRSFDTDGDGALDLKREVRDAIVVHSQEVQSERVQRFKQLVGRVIADRSGWEVDVTERQQERQPIHWLVIQVNNPHDRRLVEAADLLAAAQRHPEQPHVDIVNFTEQLNALPEGEFTALIEQFLTEYCESLEERRAKLGLFDLSGHSNGTEMLQEVPNEGSADPSDHWYVPKWNPRESLRRLRQASPAVAHQTDICETVALQACFQGGNAAAWAEIFTNEDVVIAGTKEFAPLSSSHASHAIAQGALTAREALEDGASAEAAANQGLHVPHAGLLRNDRGFVVYMRNPATALAHARLSLSQLEQAYNEARARIAAVRSAGSEALARYGQQQLDELYALVLSYQNALSTVWVLEGRPGGDDGERARQIDTVSFIREDLFALRKHAYSERPEPPPWLQQEG